MAPLLPTNSLPLPGDDDPIEAWGPGTGAGTGAGAAGEETPPRASAEPGSLPPPPPLRRTNAFADALGREPTEEDEEIELLSRMRALRSRLQLKQRNLYKDLSSHDGERIAAADYEWSELDHKIRAIESLLSTFRFVFRTG